MQTVTWSHPQTVPARPRGANDTTPTNDNRQGRVLIIEDNTVAATGLCIALSERGFDVDFIIGPSANDPVEHARRLQPDCIVLDIHLGFSNGHGINLIEPLSRTGATVVVLTAERRRPILAACLEAGAAGWINKNTDLDHFHATLSDAIAGRPIVGRTERSDLLEQLRTERSNALRDAARFEELTQREALVLSALADGLTAEEIAQQHYVALSTVRSQIRAVLRKLGVRSQLAAVAIADAHRWLLPDHSVDSKERRRSTKPMGAELDLGARSA